jgi:purine-binding chemotaxis protein CheW
MKTWSGTVRLIEFECRGQRLALPLDCVRRAVPSAATAPLPGASDIVLGVLNVGGEVVTVVDLCRRLGLQAAPIAPSQQILVLELSGFLAGVVVDRVVDVTERAAASLVPEAVGSAPWVAGLVRLADGLCLVVDPARFLFPHEAETLSRALAEVNDGAH